MSNLSTGADTENFTIGEIEEFDKETCLDFLLARAYGRTDYNRLVSVLVREEIRDLRKIRELAYGIRGGVFADLTRLQLDAVCARYAALTKREDVRDPRAGGTRMSERTPRQITCHDYETAEALFALLLQAEYADLMLFDELVGFWGTDAEAEAVSGLVRSHGFATHTNADALWPLEVTAP